MQRHIATYRDWTIRVEAHFHPFDEVWEVFVSVLEPGRGEARESKHDLIEKLAWSQAADQSEVIGRTMIDRLLHDECRHSR